MSFNPSERRFELHEIEFERGKTPRWSATNPAKCTVCHGEDPKPIWASYRTWPGVYGRNDDRLDEKTFETYDEIPELSKSDFLKFHQFAQTHPRYRSLNWKANDECYPYHCGSDDLDKNVDNSPNSRLTALTGLNYAISIARRVQNSGNFERFKYTLAMLGTCSLPEEKGMPIIRYIAKFADVPKDELAILSKTDWINQFSPTSYLNAFDIPYGSTNTAPRISQSLDGRPNAVFNQGSTAETGFPNGMNNDSDFVVDYVALQVLRVIATQDSYLAKSLSAYHEQGDFSSDPTSVYYSSGGLVPYMKGQKGLFDSKLVPSLCKYLKSKSRVELTALNQPKLTPYHDLSKSPLEIVGREILEKGKCIQCHDQQLVSTAPKIPFAHPAEFKDYVEFQSSIGIDGLAHIRAYIDSVDGKMPPVGARLEVDQINKLMEYLNELAK